MVTQKRKWHLPGIKLNHTPQHMFINGTVIDETIVSHQENCADICGRYHATLHKLTAYSDIKNYCYFVMMTVGAIYIIRIGHDRARIGSLERSLMLSLRMRDWS